ncbi:hypothetical protein Vadar_022017 [Vaccinium darrowii]|uniref:Uncharacterized protein n=1 Tax=Vaccinium darrowii TaxID=229202 RepID=A0ACB7ZM27_9ERIC|nr:hypothetical protein Vadar_022017 [Vaccinium darrowii]
MATQEQPFGEAAHGYSGAAIWGSSPSIDITRNLVYIGTGNLYNAPPEVLAFQAKQNNQTTKPGQPDQCIGLDVNVDSMMAFDLDSGKTLGNWRI